MDEYFNIDYDLTRYYSYFDVITELAHIKQTKNILDIGVGSHFFSNYLKSNGYDVISLDVCRDLHPDVTASVVNLPFETSAFDVGLCCEVLEHLPYECFKKGLSELYRVVTQFVILSIPDSSYYLSVHLRYSPMKEYKHVFSFPILLHRKLIFNGAHYWEVGRSGYPLSEISKAIADTGFTVLKTYRSIDNPYCRMFLLRKLKDVKNTQ